VFAGIGEEAWPLQSCEFLPFLFCRELPTHEAVVDGCMLMYAAVDVDVDVDVEVDVNIDVHVSSMTGTGNDSMLVRCISILTGCGSAAIPVCM